MMHIYVETMKKNPMLLIVTVVLLLCTVWFWIGFPVYGLSEMNGPKVVQILTICLSIGFCFSLFFIPFHVAFAKAYGRVKQKNVLGIFGLTQSIFVVFAAMLCAFVYFVVPNLL